MGVLSHHGARQLLNTEWSVSNEDCCVPLSVPGDVHSALLLAKVIEDPYWRDNETKLDWVHEAIWVAEREFELSIPSGHSRLTFESIDCVADGSGVGILMFQN